ncbi:sulfurtransferase-like selenium metabolism protein YedF [Clostridiales bacterium AM23-16LB]|nr:sulfurtransferase-like selenium metabolism protein YedF [Clostridiales bacterium AM23-16LB]RHR46158.1 sulfurtransferase-like selenium metabolism protein YedF [Clostridiaceae bacterium AF18-31LB]RHW00654.1 sulfurtransferase-like selenium metabolism protein YedF [Clostridiaceae bacterium OF09-1]
MITVNAIGDACPVPVVKTRKAMETIKGAEVVETLVDNEIAVENLKKMAGQMGYQVKDQKLEEGKYSVQIMVTEAEKTEKIQADICDCRPTAASDKVVVIRSNVMGEGDPELGKVLIKGFIYALSQQEELPKTILFYNGGAYLTCEGSASLDDLKELEHRGVKILTCGTCLNFYGLSEKLKVGEVTNMYEIAATMSKASLIVSP